MNNTVLKTQSYGVQLISAERDRQIDSKGFSKEADDRYTNEELACAGSCYMLPDRHRHNHWLTRLWPKNWALTWWQPHPETIKGRIEELAKAGALAAAEIDRLERLLNHGRLATQNKDHHG